jgi:hypothetical protein
MLHNEVASSEKAGPDWVKHACRRMKHFAALPQNMKHRRCDMKQSLFRLHIFCLESRQKNGGERVNFQPLNAKLKNRYFTLNYPQLWHFIAHHLQSPEINKTGKKWGMPHSMVKKVEESIVCLSANLRTGNPTIIPTDLKTVKYSMEQQIFNSYGEELGIFSGIK